ncbi:MAG: DUF6493 family protein [Pelagimonas sp.]|uniref:DUF6493 family protein n=1 Tax=Pelagimonas sp. TaxID=2073170 RepID=UPI003D6A748A
MTEQEFLEFISSNSAPNVLERLAKTPAKERRAFAKPAMALFKKLDTYWNFGSEKPQSKVSDGEAVSIAVLATASQSELTKLPFFPMPAKIPIEDILRKLDPDWTQGVVDHFVNESTFSINGLQKLWQAGLCQRPVSDAIILGYYSHWSGTRTEDSKAELLDGDVWRFFDVEGGGENSLANHDKYLEHGQESWADRIKRYSDEGLLDRQRLLDASLDALDRDFAQYRAGWYSRFHMLMAPDVDEMAKRSDRYLRLLSSSVPPTVSFALKHVQKLEKSEAIAPEDLLAALEPALQARAKGTVTAALRLLLSAAKRKPELKHEAAAKAVLALILEDAGVQAKALDAIEALGAESVSDELADYVDVVAPSIRLRIAEMTGTAPGAAPDAERNIAPNQARPIEAVASPDEALALFLTVLESPRDPFDVERAIDGISRFGAELGQDVKTLSPLRKRAKQVCQSLGDCEIRYVLAMTGRALAENVPLAEILAEERDRQNHFRYVTELSLQEHHLARNAGVIERVGDGASLPLLALPSETSGLVHVADLLARMECYRKQSVEPEPHDMAMALMRLAPEGRDVGKLPLATEADRAIAYALGQDVKVGPTPELWGAAWRARLPEQADKAITKLFKGPFSFKQHPVPDCGASVAIELQIDRQESKDGTWHWLKLEVPVTPANTMWSRALPALFCFPDQGSQDPTNCGQTFADIAWASITRPANPELFFRVALLGLDTSRKLADNPIRAYLEPFFRPGPPVGQIGAAMLACFMACEDKSVSSLAIEATAGLSAEGRLTVRTFANELKKVLMSHSLPTNRWTKALKDVADMGSPCFALDTIVSLLDFEPDETPRDIGAMLELCYELHVAQKAQLTNERALACLRSLPGGGKTARFSKKLLSLTAQGSN